MLEQETEGVLAAAAHPSAEDTQVEAGRKPADVLSAPSPILGSVFVFEVYFFQIALLLFEVYYTNQMF